MKALKLGFVAILFLVAAVVVAVRNGDPRTSRPSSVGVTHIVTASGERLPNFFHGLSPSPVNDYRKVAGANRPRPPCGSEKSSFFWHLIGGTTVYASVCFAQRCSGVHFEDYAIECGNSVCTGVYNYGRQNMAFPKCSGIQLDGTNGCDEMTTECPCNWTVCYPAGCS
jgi:hypothetical protein